MWLWRYDKACSTLVKTFFFLWKDPSISNNAVTGFCVQLSSLWHMTGFKVSLKKIKNGNVLHEYFMAVNVFSIFSLWEIYRTCFVLLFLSFVVNRHFFLQFECVLDTTVKKKRKKIWGKKKQPKMLSIPQSSQRWTFRATEGMDKPAWVISSSLN